MRDDELWLGRWFGYGPRWKSAFGDACRAIHLRRHTAISAPRGAAIDELVFRLRGTDENKRVIAVRVGIAIRDARTIRDAVRSGDAQLVVVAEAAQSEALLEAAAIAPEIVVLRVPEIGHRREDLARLLAEARARVEEQLQLKHSSTRWDLPALFAYGWPGHLDEIERVMRMIVAVRATGSLRRAASMLDTTKSTLADQLRLVGIRIATSR